MERLKSRGLFRRAIAVAALSALASAACASSQPAPAPKPVVAQSEHKPRARGGGPIALVAAADVITWERCEHERTCNRLGPGRRFADSSSCEKKLIHEARTQLRTEVCETGFVESTSLRECLDAIRAGRCNVEPEATSACEVAKMCSP